VAVILLAVGEPVLAQCAMCKTVAAAQGEKAAQALDWAILVLFIPAMLIFTGVYFLAYRMRNAQDVDESEPEQPWDDESEE
jgi:heme/copper-type cytochrome/quinol oxidase subunit 2